MVGKKFRICCLTVTMPATPGPARCPRPRLPYSAIHFKLWPAPAAATTVTTSPRPRRPPERGPDDR